MAATFFKALQALRPGVDFSNLDNTLAGIRWDTPGVVPPTQAEVDAAMAATVTPAQKLAAIGLTVDDLKALLK